MDRNILLTYIHVKGYTTYEWFEDMEECNEFIKDSKDKIYKIFECCRIGIVKDMEEELNYKIGEEL
jgi:hypothetical protein